MSFTDYFLATQYIGFLFKYFATAFSRNMPFILPVIRLYGLEASTYFLCVFSIFLSSFKKAMRSARNDPKLFKVSEDEAIREEKIKVNKKKASPPQVGC